MRATAVLTVMARQTSAWDPSWQADAGGLFNVPANLGHPVPFPLGGGESAGALIPGETALVVAAALASQGRLSPPLVIGVGAGAAIIRDNIGYLIGRRGLGWLVGRPGRLAARR